MGGEARRSQGGRTVSVRQGMNKSDMDSLPKPQEMILWSHPTWTAQDYRGVMDTVEWLVHATESVARAADPEVQLHKHIREARRRVEKVGKDQEHAKIGDLFAAIDTDGSGRLEWEEVSEGAAKLGVKDKEGQEQLRVLFSQVADEWREVDRRQFDYLLSSLRAAQQYGGAYVFEVSEVVNALRGELAALAPASVALKANKDKVRYATTTSTGGPMTTGKYSRASGNTQRRDSHNVLASAAQRVCRLAHHGDPKRRRQRQLFVGEQGAIALLTRVLSLNNYDCVFWAAQALLALVEENRENADMFEDVGGMRVVSDLLAPAPPPRRPAIPILPIGGTVRVRSDASSTSNTSSLVSRQSHGDQEAEASGRASAVAKHLQIPARTQTALVHLSEAACNSSGDARLELQQDLRLVERAICDIKHATMESGAAYALGIEPMSAPLIGAFVGLICSMACLDTFRPFLRHSGVSQPLAQMAMDDKRSAKVRSLAAMAVGMTVGSCWDTWADAHLKDKILQQVCTTLELASYAAGGGQLHLCMACMALSVLSSNSENRAQLELFGAPKLVQSLLIGAGGGGAGEASGAKGGAEAEGSSCSSDNKYMYPPTEAALLLALWHLSLDDRPYTPAPRPYACSGVARGESACERLYHCKYPMALPQCKPPRKVKSFIVHWDRWTRRRDGNGGDGGRSEEAAAGLPPMNAAQLVDLHGLVLWDRQMNLLTDLLANQFGVVEMAFSDAERAALGEGSGLTKDALVQMLLSLDQQQVISINRTRCELIFDAAAKLYVPLPQIAKPPPAIEKEHQLQLPSSSAGASGGAAAATSGHAASKAAGATAVTAREDEGGRDDGSAHAGAGREEEEEGGEGTRISLPQLKSLVQVNAESFLENIAEGIRCARKFRWSPQREIWRRADLLAGEWNNAEAAAAADVLGFRPQEGEGLEEGLLSALTALGAPGAAKVAGGSLDGAAADKRWWDLRLPDGVKALRVLASCHGERIRVDSLAVWEPEVVMELVGWEWDPRRLQKVCEDSEDSDSTENVLWDRFDSSCVNWGLERYLEIMGQVSEVIEPESGEYDPDSDDEDSEDEGEGEHKHQAATREEQVQAEALALVEKGEALSLSQGLVLAEKRVFKRSFDAVDEDGSGRVDAEEVLNAFRRMGQASTEADVARMMAAVDEGGRLAALEAQVGKLLHMDQQLKAGGLGLKERDKAELGRLQKQLLALRERLDIDEHGAYGFEAYRLMVKFNDCQPVTHRLPRMVPMVQAVCLQRHAHVVFKNAPSRSWAEVYGRTPRTIERVRDISRLGAREMALMSSLLRPNECEKRAIGVLWVLGEQPIQTAPRHVRGHALLCYDACALPHIPAVKRVLEEAGMPWAEQRDASHFQQFVRACGLLVAVMGSDFQYCPQCRSEVMIARQLGKTVLFVRVDDFTVSEAWLQHQLGIPTAVPRLLHTLPSCNTWLRGSRRVQCCLPPPHTANRRPPVVTGKDYFEYCLPSDGTPGGAQAVVLDRKTLGGCWVVQRSAQHPAIAECVPDRSLVKSDIVPGPLVIDFRPAPELPRLQAEAIAAAAACAEVESVVQKRLEDVVLRQADVDAAREVLEGTKREVDRVGALRDGAEMHAAEQAAAYEEVSKRAAEAVEALAGATKDIVQAAERSHALADEKEARHAALLDAQRAHDASNLIVLRMQAELKSDLAKLNRTQDILERAEVEHESALPLLEERRAARDETAARLRAEQERAAESLQLVQHVDALRAQVAQYRKLQSLAMFLGQAVFYKCWIKICYFAGARVQLKRKMAPYLKRPLFYGFDALVWHKAEEKKRRKQLAVATRAFYGVSTKRFFDLWRDIFQTQASASDRAQEVLQRFLRMFGVSRRDDAFAGWRAWQRNQKKARVFANAHIKARKWRDWLEHWRDVLLLFERVAQKCSIFLALLTGESQRDCLIRWKQHTRNKRVAGLYRLERDKVLRKSSWLVWVEWVAEEKMQKRLNGEAIDKLKHLVAMMNADAVRECFDMWAAACAKKRRAMRLWKNKTINWAFGCWYSELAEFFEIREKVYEKCAGILKMIWGEADHKCFLGWKELVVKKRQAIMRWANSALISCLETWKEVTTDAVRVKKLLQRVYHSWNMRSVRWGFCRWFNVANERLYNRDLVHDAISMWMHVREIHALRTLDEFAQEQRNYKRIVNSFRRRFEMRPAQLAVLAWAELVAEEKARQKKIRKFCFKFRNRELVFAFRRMHDLVQDRQLAEREAMMGASPVLMRLVLRPLVLTIAWWRAGVQRRQHLRSAGTAVAYGRWRRLLLDALDRWANVFVDLSFQDRLQDLRVAALAAVDSNDLSGVLAVLHAHAAWARPRTHSRSNLVLDNFLSTADKFDPATVARRAASMRRVALLRHMHLRGARAPIVDQRQLQLPDVIRLQKALSRETAGGEMPLYWRTIEALSVLLKTNSAHPLAPGALEAAEAENPEVDQNDGVGLGEGEAEVEGDAGAGRAQLRATRVGREPGGEGELLYAATPPGTAREDAATIEALSWEAVAQVNVLHPKLAAQLQIVPTYLGGRYARLGLQKLRTQVHGPTYPLKWNQSWDSLRNELEDAELSRRYFRARRAALRAIEQQGIRVKTAYLQRKEAEQAVTAAHDREGKARKEAQRKLDEALKLENENPFQQQLNIRKMRAHALELTAQADAAAAQGAAAQETALHWVRVLEDEEVKHTALVSDSAPLLRDKDEALQLLAWHDLPVAAVPPPPLLPVLATPHDDVATKPAQTQHAVLPQEQSPGEARHRADSVGAVAHGALTAAARGEGGERERDRVTLPHIAEVGGAAEVLSVSRTTSWGTVSGDEASSLPSEPSRGSWHVSDTDVGVATVTAGSGGAMVVEETEGEGLNVNRGSRPRSQGKETSRDKLLQILRSDDYQSHSAASFKQLSATGKLEIISQLPSIASKPSSPLHSATHSRSNSRPVSRQESRANSPLREASLDSLMSVATASGGAGSEERSGGSSPIGRASPLRDRGASRAGSRAGSRAVSRETSNKSSKSVTSLSPQRDRSSSMSSRAGSRSGSRPVSREGSTLSLPKI